MGVCAHIDSPVVTPQYSRLHIHTSTHLLEMDSTLYNMPNARHIIFGDDSWTIAFETFLILRSSQHGCERLVGTCAISNFPGVYLGR